MTEPYLVAESGGALFAVRQANVREIVAPRHLTRLPGAPAAVRGILNVRGAMVTVLDLAAQFSLGAAAADGSVVIATAAGRSLGLLVSDVLDVATFGPETLLPPSPAQRAAGGNGMGHFGERIVLAVDLEELARIVFA